MDRNIFEVATRQKVRFDFRGSLSVEDLWDLTLEQLDIIYAGLSEQAKLQEVKHLMDTSRTDDGLALRMALVQRVFNVKVEERNARVTREQTRAEYERLLDIKARKQDAALEGLGEEELDAKIAEILEKL